MTKDDSDLDDMKIPSEVLICTGWSCFWFIAICAKVPSETLAEAGVPMIGVLAVLLACPPAVASVLALRHMGAELGRRK